MPMSNAEKFLDPSLDVPVKLLLMIPDQMVMTVMLRILMMPVLLTYDKPPTPALPPFPTTQHLI